MNVVITYVDYDATPFQQERLQQLAYETLRTSRYASVLVDKTITIDVAVIDTQMMHEANQRLRNVDGVTDVLSIGDYSDDHDIATESAQRIMLGELLLCWSDIKKNAIIQGTPAQWEFAYVFVHGILHLLGYVHGEKMFAIQQKISDQYYNTLQKK